MVRFGTKCPSITSTWSQSAPAASIISTSLRISAKSQESSEGEMSTVRSVMWEPRLRGQGEAGLYRAGPVISLTSAEGADPRELLTLQELEGCAAPRGDMRDSASQP